MSHLRFIEIENFKSFGAPFKFEFAPITILTGTNSSGKSNLIKALSLLSNSQKENNFFQTLNFYKDKRLGSFNSSLNTSTPREDVYIKFRMPITMDYLDGDFFIELKYEEEQNDFSNNGILSGIEIYKFEGTNRITIFLFSFTTKKIESSSGEIRQSSISGKEVIIPDYDLETNFEIQFNYLFIINELNKIVGKYKIPNIDENSKTRKALIERILQINIDEEMTRTAKEKIIFNGFYEEVSARELAKPEFNRKDKNELIRFIENLNNSNVIFKYYSPGRMYDVEDLQNTSALSFIIKAETNAINDLSSKINNMDEHDYNDEFKPYFLTSDFLKKLIYRCTFDSFSYPLDGALIDQLDRTNILTSFGDLIINTCFINNIEETFSRLRKDFDINFLGSIRGTQSHLTSRFENKPSTLFDLMEEYLSTKNPFLLLPDKFINYWISSFNIGDSISFEATASGIVKALIVVKENRHINVADLGFGATQLIPIIIQIALNANKFFDIKTSTYKHSTICIEEPEANLHPSLQSKLADMFIDAAHKFNIQFILETHSEYIIRKMQYWVADGSINADAINLYYFNEPGKTETYINKINITDEGSLTEDFGPGFFDEADKIALDLFLLNKAQKN